MNKYLRGIWIYDYYEWIWINNGIFRANMKEKMKF